MLFEMALGKAAALEGRLGDGTPFKEIEIHKIGEILARNGFQSLSHEALVDGTTGELYPGTQIFMGPCYYQRLKHMTKDKIHARNRGPVQLLNRQPSEGRSRAGGLKFGEMEGDCLKTHGTASFAIDRLRTNADSFSIQVCESCGNMVPGDLPEDKKQVLGQMFPTETQCPVCGNESAGIYQANVAYASKLLLQELQALHFGLRLFPKKE
jgi:DNA-directed RNA polymerase beta subunit